MEKENNVTISKAEYDAMQKKINVRRGPRKGMPGIGRPMKPENRIRRLVEGLTEEQKIRVQDLVIDFINGLQEEETDSVDE